MSLDTYKQKRSFDKTPEPKGGKNTGKELLFVIQKHHATRLHYDFRLEIAGALKSWAVPKGPSLNPKDKRLAMLVEDHPLDYKDFEGIIPAGNYGAGTVIVWDRGTYEPLEALRTKKEKEKNLLKNFAEGSIKIKMYGKKLKGEFALVRTKGRGENSWLLIKHRDEYASEEDVTLQDASVITGKRLEDLKATPKKKREETEKVKGTKSQASSPDALEKAKDAEEKQDFEQAIKFYQQEIKERPQDEHSYQRLMVVYRKLKKYKEELKVIEAGIQAFEELNERKTGQLVADNDKIKKLSTALMKSLGMQDKKGNPLYEPEPIAKWKKRRQIVEKKITG